jgi:hypothetical protein
MDILQPSLQGCYTEAACSSQTMENNNYTTWRHESPPWEFKAHKIINTDFPLGKIWKVSDWYLAVQNTSKCGKVIHFLFGRWFGMDSWQVQAICLYSTQARPSLRPNQSATQCTGGGSFSWIRRLHMKLTIHFHLEATFKTRRAIPPLHHMPSWRTC